MLKFSTVGDSRFFIGVEQVDIGMEGVIMVKNYLKMFTLDQL